jgi:hypothetical protein
MADDWGSIGGTVASAAPSGSQAASAQSGGSDGGWGSIGGTVASAAPGAQQSQLPVPKLAAPINGVNRQSDSYLRAMAYYAPEHPEIFQGYGTKGNPGRGDAGLESFLNEASGGLANEGEARLEQAATGLAAMFGAKPGFSADEAYQAKKDLAQIAQNVRDRKYPVTTTAAGIAGAIAPWLTGGGEAAAGEKALSETPQILKTAEDAPNLVGRAVKAGKVALGSAAQGGLTTYNDSNGPQAQRLGEAAQAAGVSGLVGGAGEGVAQALPFGWRAGKRAIAKAADYLSDSSAGAGWNPANATAQAGARISDAGLTPEDFRGDPTALAGRLKQNMDDVSARYDTQIAAQRANAQGAAPDTSGVAPADVRGGEIRNAVEGARSNTASNIRPLYQVLDKENPTVNVVASREGATIPGEEGEEPTQINGAKQILEGLTEDDKLKPDEAEILQRVASLPDVLPFKNLNAIRSRIGEIIRDPANANTRNATYGRMVQLRNALHWNMANSIADRVAEDQAAVAAGHMANEDALGEQLAQAATGTDSAQPVAPSRPAAPTPMDMSVDARQELGQAAADVQQWRASLGPKENLLNVIRGLGGIRMKTSNGLFADGASEIADSLGGTGFRPGLVNNKAGLTPDALRKALAERGWFSGNDGSIDDLTNMIRRDVATGGRVFHPDSEMPARLAHQQGLGEEMSRAGVASGDRPDVAARKLAIYRAAQNASDMNQAALWGRLRDAADRLGVSYGSDTSYDQLLQDVAEAHPAGMTPEQLADHLELLDTAIDHGVQPHEFDRHTDLTYGRPGDQPAAGGEPAAAGGGGENPGGQAAPGQSGAGGGGGGQAPRGAPAEVIQPTVTPEQQAAAAQANALWQKYKQKFFSGPIGKILTKDGQMQWRMRDGNVPGQFFKSGPDAYENMQALKRVLGKDAYDQMATNEAIASLKGSQPGAPDSVLRSDGAVDPAKFEKWKARYAQAIRALPDGVADRFQTAADATSALDEAEGAKAAALKDAQDGALGKIMGLDNAEDIGKAVKGILGGQGAAGKMRALADAVKGDPDATAGLRRAVFDNMADMIGKRPASLQTFLTNNAEALSSVLSKKEMAGLQQLAAKSGKQLQTVGDIVQEHGADAALHVLSTKVGGPVGLVGSLIGRKAVSVLTRNGMSSVNDLVAEGLRNPDFMRELVNAADRVKATRAARNARIEDMSPADDTAQAVRLGRALGVLSQPGAVRGATDQPR